MYFCIKSSIGIPRVKLASCKIALTSPSPPPPSPASEPQNTHTAVYSTDRSKAVVPVLVLLFVTLRFILRGDLFYVLPCLYFFVYVFQSF